jgi:hypothetical protein
MFQTGEGDRFMNDCFICKRSKSMCADRMGMYCNFVLAYCDDVEYCKLFSDSEEETPNTTNPEKKMADNSILEKIQKLFALGKSPNMNEAASALRKAQALMDEYNLSFGEVNYITEFEKLKGRKIYTWELNIFAAVCYANNCVPALGRGTGMFSVCGRKINAFLSLEMFRYLTETVKRLAKNDCKNKGHKYNMDYKMAASYALTERLEKYGDMVSWAADREEELNNIKNHRQLKSDKKENNFSFGNHSAVMDGYKSGQGISLVKQTGIDEIKQIGASV